jgi:hypothetical protein
MGGHTVCLCMVPAGELTLVRRGIRGSSGGFDYAARRISDRKGTGGILRNAVAPRNHLEQKAPRLTPADFSSPVTTRSPPLAQSRQLAALVMRAWGTPPRSFAMAVYW